MTDTATTTERKAKQYRGFAVIKDKNPDLQRDISSRGGVSRAAQRVGEVVPPRAPREPTQAGRVVFRTVERARRWWHILLPFLEPRVDVFRIDIGAEGSVGLRIARPGEGEGRDW